MASVFLNKLDTREKFNSHLKSEIFRVLRGAMNFIREPYEMLRHTVAAGKKRQQA
jgi:hypothetical protein